MSICMAVAGRDPNHSALWLPPVLKLGPRDMAKVNGTSGMSVSIAVCSARRMVSGRVCGAAARDSCACVPVALSG